MALNLDRIPTDVLDDLLERVDDDRDKIAQMSVREAFNEWLVWNGIIGYTRKIISALDNLRAAEIDPVVKPIAWHYVCVTHPNLKPEITKCDSEDAVLVMAKQAVADGLDPYEVSLGIMIVNNDGTVSNTEFTVDEVTPD